ncbi:hypothetical protein M2R47_09255 [Moraxella sp. Tifton1]|uniref:hypothetical protein n=1 Tax=Moraxella oculi TaxID=2940516 RepID=UPI002011F1FB|nr:hypothetical protein [Moraxella sp. Tifton1]MCL1624413.1 hypothetical protein [Moraxella sp. Tifton1]
MIDININEKYHKGDFFQKNETLFPYDQYKIMMKKSIIHNLQGEPCEIFGEKINNPNNLYYCLDYLDNCIAISAFEKGEYNLLAIFPLMSLTSASKYFTEIVTDGRVCMKDFVYIQ